MHPYASMQEQLRSLPSVDRLLNWLDAHGPSASIPRPIKLRAARETIDAFRKRIVTSSSEEAAAPFDETDICREAARLAMKLDRPRLRRTINATGIIIHTNLGRSLLAQTAIDNIAEIASHYSNLEYNLEKGKRGSRYTAVEDILCEISGAEAAMVVNNNAAGVLLCLDTIAKGREVIVSRGELIEIGGSFRIPDVMAKSGAILKEVGTTNRTHLRDYETALTPDTALLLKVHTSNYRILGFTASVPLGALVELAKARSLPVMEDLGSGTFIDFSRYGLVHEPTVQESIAAGADIVTFSGDKLLGGPQAGIILGKPAWIEAIRKNPLTRALRIDKLTLAALEATLRLYRNPEAAVETIPTLQGITRSKEDLRPRAERLLHAIEGIADPGLQAAIVDVTSQAGGGSLPLLDLPSLGVSLVISGRGPNEIESALRSQPLPVIGRIESDRFVMDVRTLCEAEIDLIADAVRRMLKDFAASRS
ncbi:MAG: L-seryl-tRNA(Sec) selenium transferase [Thermodesulfobacteriota bacterium]